MEDEINHHWGKYKFSNYPKVEWDSFQSFFEKGDLFGYRVHVVPSRGNRTRENKLPSSDKIEEDKLSSLLLEIVFGEKESIPISGDQNHLSSPNDDPKLHNLEKFNGVTIINKFSPNKISGGAAEGVAILSFPTKKITNLSDPQANNALLVSLRTSIEMLQSNKFGDSVLDSSIIFFNIGPSSGASLMQLHAQAYVIPRASGLLSLNFNKAYLQSFEKIGHCLFCDFATKESLVDHINQKIDLSLLTIIEDKNARLMISNAPIRPLALRIIPKTHIANYADCTSETIASISNFLSIADKLIFEFSKPTKIVRKDRTIAFRQALTNKDDFHFFIDVMPSIPFGGAEVIDSLTISTLDSFLIGPQLKKLVYDLDL